MSVGTRDKLGLSLDGFCIETTAKQRLRVLTERLLNGEERAETMAEAEFLRQFLETGEFSALRADNPGLDGSHRSEVTITREASGEFAVRVERDYGPAGG